MASGTLVKKNGKATASAVSDHPTIEPVEIRIPALEKRRVLIEIVGDTPLIVHAWSEKAKEMMRAKQQKRASKGKEVRDPQRDFEESLYVIDPANKVYGFPALAFKNAAVNAAMAVDVKKVHMRQAFHIDNGYDAPQGYLVPIEGQPTMREDMVRIGMGTADLRYRAEFREWRVKLEITYNARAISVEQLIALLNAGGYGVGVGEWRPERDGRNGRFSVGDVVDA